MLRSFIAILLLIISPFVFSQQKLDKLTVEKIMRDPVWMGTSPSNLQWSNEGTSLYFNWNPEKAPADSLYYITLNNRLPVKASPAQTQSFNTTGNFIYNGLRTAYVYSKDADIFYTDVKTGKTKRITQTTDVESNPQFSFNETKIVYNRNQNLYAWDIAGGETMQLTNLKTGDAVPATPIQGRGGNNAGRANREISNQNQQEDWLKNDQLQYFEVLRSRKEKREKGEAYNRSLPKPKETRSINIEDKSAGTCSKS